MGVRTAEKTYQEDIRGCMAPVVMVSTRTRNGMTESTLWCEEKGVNQCTARLCAQTTSTKALMGSTQSISVSMACA